MASVVEELNQLLARERGEVEALDVLVEQFSKCDPDLVRGAEDARETASWACSGLYHRINQLHGTPTLDSSRLADRVINEPETQQKVKIVCGAQKQDVRSVKSLLKRDDIDDATRSFLRDMLNAYDASADWCASTLGEWERDI